MRYAMQPAVSPTKRCVSEQPKLFRRVAIRHGVLPSITGDTAPMNDILKEPVGPSFEEAMMQTIMGKLEELRGRYVDRDGVDLLVGGLDSYIKPAKFADMAKTNNFRDPRSFPIHDEAMIEEVRLHLEQDRMVIVAAWTQEGRTDVYVEGDF